MPQPRLLLRSLAFLVFALGILFAPKTAQAYPWMIRHEYTHCVQCHMDPSGAGILTPYGRAQGEILLRTHYGPPSEADEEPGKLGQFLWGAVPLPEGVEVQGDLRSALLTTKVGSAPATTRYLQMVADLGGGLSLGRFRAAGTIGFNHAGALQAAVTHNTENNLVSRYYWAGVALGEEENVLLRAGRLNLPYGIRNIEHTLLVRQSTRTDYNQAQQHGVALSYDGDWLRGELMAIVGNFQVNPDAYRERGYTGYLEAAVAAKATVGVSSLVTHASRDINQGVADTRQAHGLFSRVTIVEPLVLMAEVDLLHESLASSATASAGTSFTGYAALLQADYEAIQGLHFIATGDAGNSGQAGAPGTLGAWLSSAWFFAPHADVRVDGTWQSVTVNSSSASGSTNSKGLSLLAQLHVYL